MTHARHTRPARRPARLLLVITMPSGPTCIDAQPYDAARLHPTDALAIALASLAADPRTPQARFAAAKPLTAPRRRGRR